MHRVALNLREDTQCTCVFMNNYYDIYIVLLSASFSRQLCGNFIPICLVLLFSLSFIYPDFPLSFSRNSENPTIVAEFCEIHSCLHIVLIGRRGNCSQIQSKKVWGIEYTVLLSTDADFHSFQLHIKWISYISLFWVLVVFIAIIFLGFGQHLYLLIWYCRPGNPYDKLIISLWISPSQMRPKLFRLLIG